MMATVAKIALQGATLSFDKLYNYVVPENMELSKGCRVIVPFGKGNFKKQGMVFELANDDVHSLKQIISVIDSEPVLTDELIEMCKYMQESILCTYYDAVNVMLPSGITHKLIDFYSANEEFVTSLLNTDELPVYEYLLK